MSVVEGSPLGEEIIRDIDRLIIQVAELRSHVSALGKPPSMSIRSVREAEYFGMWSERDDMPGLSSREWLEKLRRQQWTGQ